MQEDRTPLPRDSQTLLLKTLEQLLAIDTSDRHTALARMSLLLADAFDADKVDILLYEPKIGSLVALGTSDTPMGRREHELGMDRMPLVNDGREVEVYRTGEAHFTGHADQDAKELPGLIEGLGIRSSMVVPLHIAGERRGVLLASSATPDRFTREQFRLFEAAAHWVGIVAHRAELIEQVRTSEREYGRRAAAEELVTVVAHDLRNYLTPLKARIDLIRRRAQRKTNSRDLEDAQVASHEIDRLGRLIANLLDVSRLEQGLFALTLQPVDLVALAQATAQAMSASENPIQVQTAPTVEEIIVTADPDRVRQALENLLANAQRYSPPHAPVTIMLHAPGAAEQHHQAPEHSGDAGRALPAPPEDNTSASARQTPQAVIAVIDRGPGIPADVLPRLFARFASGADSPGLGIGLYVASEIARAHGGRLTAASGQAGGTRFELTLPVGGPASLTDAQELP